MTDLRALSHKTSRVDKTSRVAWIVAERRVTVGEVEEIVTEFGIVVEHAARMLRWLRKLSVHFR